MRGREATATTEAAPRRRERRPYRTPVLTRVPPEERAEGRGPDVASAGQGADRDPHPD